MSESNTFANYSNMSRSLQQEAGQQQQGGTTFADKINDAANFEQQFLIGMAVHQKAKVGEQVAKYFKGSKKLQRATGLSEEDLGNIANGDFSKVTGKIAKATSKKLQESVEKVKTLKSQNLSDLADLEAKKVSSDTKKEVSDKLNNTRDEANQDLEDAKDASSKADAEVERLTGKTAPDNTSELDDIAQQARIEADAGANDDAGVSALRTTAGALRRTANADKAASDIAKTKADNTLSTRPKTDAGDDDVRLEPNPEYDEANAASRAARKVSDKSDTAASDAEQQVNDARFARGQTRDALNDTANQAEDAAAEARSSVTAAQNALSDQQASAQTTAENARASLANKTADAERANSDADAAGSEASDAADAVKAGEGVVEQNAGAVLNETEKVTGVVSKIKDFDAAAAATEEFDPLGLVIAGIGAVAASLIGRKVKTHDSTSGTLPTIASSYGSTLGA